MERGQGKGTDTLPTDNVFTRKEYIEREAALKEIENADVMCDISADAYRVLRRYIERIPASDVVYRDCYDRLLAENDELRKDRPVARCKDCIGRLAEYEDAEEKGLLVRLPCKVGDLVYRIHTKDHVEKHRVIAFHVSTSGLWFWDENGRETPVETIGKTVFLTREEADAALKGETEDV